MALGSTEEWLLVIDSDDNRFKAYTDPTSGAFDGEVPLGAASAPHDEFGIPAGAQYAGGNLYVKDRSDGDMYVYGGGEMVTIGLGMEWRISVFYIDGDDNLYVATNGDVAIYHHVSMLEGDVEPDQILTIPGADTFGGLVVDSDGTGYISDAIRNEIYVYHDIASRDGEEAPDGTIGGPRTGLSGPGDLALYEPR
jgi:hypothetical protein